jgi:PKD repeat protein
VEALERRRFLTSVVTTTPGFSINGVVADPTRNLVYALDSTNDKVLAVDTQLGRTAAHAKLAGDPTDLAVSPDGLELFVSSRAANRIQVFSLPDLFLVRELDVATPGALAAGAGDKLFVGGSDTWSAARQVDDITGEVKGTFGSFYSPLLTTNRAGTTLYVSEIGLSTTGTDEYDISDLTGLPVYKKEHNTSMSNGKDLAVDEQYNRLYAMSGGQYGVYALNMATNTGTLWSFGDYGGGVALHPDVSYIWGGGYGGIHRFDRATGTKLESITSAGGTSYRGMAMTGNGNLLFSNGTKVGITNAASITLASIPAARFKAAANPFPSLTVAFDGTFSEDYEANGVISNWVWDFGDGTFGSGSKVSHTFATPGKYTVKLTVTDGQNNTDRVTAVVNLTNPPVAQNRSANTQEEAPVEVTLHADDPDGDPVTYVIDDAPDHGTLRLSGSSVRYTPAADFFGTDTFTYRASDGTRSSTPATVTINVANVNDAPIAIDDIAVLAPSGPTTILPLANDIDVDGDTLTIASFTQPTKGGSVTRDGNTFYYTPPAGGFTGADGFTYTLSDGTTSVAGKAYVSHGAAVLSGEWHTYGASAAHAGAFAGSISNADPIASWSLPSGFTNGNAVAVGDGRVYVTDHDWDTMVLRALDPATGRVLWSRSFEGGNSLNPATFWQGRLYLQRGNHGGDTQLWAIDAATGGTIWSAPFSAQWEAYFAPAVNEQGIWINGGYYGGMYGFKHDGTQITFINQAQYDEWTPSILDNYVYSYVAGSFQKYSMNGSLQWTNSKTWNWSGWSMNRVSALANGRGFMIGNPDLYAVNLTTGATAWTVPGTFAGSPAIAGPTVYALTGSTVKAYDAATGAAGTVYTAGSTLIGQPIVTDDAVIAASSSNTYIFSRSSGQLLHTLSGGGQIALADNRLYIVKSDGSIQTYAFASGIGAVAGGPYTVDEGASVQLDGHASVIADNAVVDWEWDLNYDGVSFQVDATGRTPTFSAASIDGPATRTVALRVRNGSGLVSAPAAAAINIANFAPTATFTSGGAVTVGSAGSVSFSGASDVSQADVIAGFKYSFDFNDDGQFEVVNSSTPFATVPANFLGTVGGYTIRGRIGDDDGGTRDYTAIINVNPAPPPPPPPPTQTPFLGSPFALGASGVTIQAEDFDLGGEGVAWHDVDGINSGGKYRTTGVDIQSTTDTGGGFNVGYVKAGEWLEYMIDVADAGTYAIAARVAAASSNGKFHAEIDGVNVTGLLTVPNTGGWQNWTTVTKSGINLTAGQHVLRLFMDAAGTSGSVGNFNWLKIAPGTPPPPPPGGQSPFKGTPFAVSTGATTQIQFEDFDTGGEGVAFHDIESANLGGANYRSSGVDIQTTTDTDGGNNVGYVKAGEWLEYTIDVAQAAAGAANLDFRLASAGSSGKFHVEVDGVDVTGQLTVPNTGGWQKFTTISKTGVNLTAGQHVVRVKFDANGSTGSVGNLNWFSITPGGGPVVGTQTIGITTAAHVVDGDSANTNFGNAGSLLVKSSPNVGFSRQSFLKFDLSEITTISAAKLRLFGMLQNTSAASSQIAVGYSDDDSWTESGITWNGKPSTFTQLSTLTVSGTAGKWYEVDLTDFLQAEKAAGRNVVTIGLRGVSPNTGPYAAFNSDDAAGNRPSVVITN